MRAAIYARVSTELQEREATIQSQLEALRQYAKEHCHVIVQEFTDEGYSGTTLVRPGMDRLRDALGQGDFEVLLVHSPERLARKSIYQGILLEEFQKQGVQVQFLNCQVDDSPEGQMLLGMQGLFAEYERAKITERTRRGRLHKARSGLIQNAHAPYGYYYVKRSAAHPATLVVNEEQAQVVRLAYRWLLEEELSIRAIAKRLIALGHPAPQGGTLWRASTLGRILKSEAYAGTGYYNKRYKLEPERYREFKDYRKDPKTTQRGRPKEEWIPFSTPAIIDWQTWERAQAQLQRNSALSPRNNKRFQYLLRGLVRCGSCGRPYVGWAANGRRRYQCSKPDPMEQPEGVARCSSQPVQAEEVERLVWEAIGQTLKEPDLLVQEYERRKGQIPHDTDAQEKQLALALKGYRSRAIV